MYGTITISFVTECIRKQTAIAANPQSTIFRVKKCFYFFVLNTFILGFIVNVEAQEDEELTPQSHQDHLQTLENLHKKGYDNESRIQKSFNHEKSVSKIW